MLRPDKYVGYRADTVDLASIESVENYFRGLGGGSSARTTEGASDRVTC